MEGHTGTVLMAVALAFIFEGLLPFLMPLAWRNTFRRITEMSEGQIRFLGLSLMIIGLLLLFLTN